MGKKLEAHLHPIGRRLAALGIACAALLGGCAMLEVPGQQRLFESSARFLGTVRTDGPRPHPLVVVLARWDGEDATLVDHFVRDRPGRFFFTASPGRYVVSAFEDVNANLRYDPEEPAIPLEEAVFVEVASGEVREGIELVVHANRRAGFGRSIDVSDLLSRTRNDQVNVSFGHLKVRGRVATLSDPRFHPDNGRMGLWQPFDFLLDVGAGIYMLETYDPNRTPVVFVHGMGGSPLEFELLIESLDREQFQPWVFYYPSGVYLDRLAEHLQEILVELRVRLGFDRVDIVAHSMGGLVARAFVQQRTEAGGDALVRTIVSISTPWGGHGAAGTGAEKAPIVVYAWEDLAPGSPFLEWLLGGASPTGICHHLIFSYHRDALRPGASSDEVVSVASQLRSEVQREAHSVYGVDASHRGVLRSGETATRVSDLLERPCPRP